MRRKNGKKRTGVGVGDVAADDHLLASEKTVRIEREKQEREKRETTNRRLLADRTEVFGTEDAVDPLGELVVEFLWMGRRRRDARVRREEGRGRKDEERKERSQVGSYDEMNQ